MDSQPARTQCLVGPAITVFGLLLALSGPLHGQALAVEELPNGTQLVHLAQPLAEATAVLWSSPGAQAASPGVLSGSLTLAADLESALNLGEDALAPAVVVAAGGAGLQELRSLLTRLLAGRAPEPGAKVVTAPLVEGGIERTLGAPGSDAVLRLVMPLPAVDDWRRPAVEVLWEVIPGILADDLPGTSGRIDQSRGLLEARVDPDLAELRLRYLRLTLSRLAGDPRIAGERIEAARRRLMVRRLAELEAPEAAARRLLERWQLGRAEAVRQLVFGLEGVTFEGVRGAASQWLPQHPGHAVVVLPPQVFAPRFAAPPERLSLSSDMSAVVLERPASPLSALCVRPVLLPDLDGELSATVLTRVAAQLRAGEDTPGWIAVRSRPATLELAASADGFAELCEQLAVALRVVADDDTEVSLAGGGARRRALQLMAGQLGLSEGAALQPSDLLSTSNLVLGVVAADGEAAGEAIQKMLGGLPAARSPAGRTVGGSRQTREAAPGRLSVLIACLPLASRSEAVTPAVLSKLLEARAASLLEGIEVDIVRPLVPGRLVLLLVASAELPLDRLETRLRSVWPRLTAAPAEAEMVTARRLVAGALASEMSGALGHARACAAVAAGESSWRQPAETEMITLGLPAEALGATLAELADWSELLVTGAGVLPVTELAEP